MRKAIATRARSPPERSCSFLPSLRAGLTSTLTPAGLVLRAGLLQEQAPAAAREQDLDHVRELLLHGGEDLGELGVDLAS